MSSARRLRIAPFLLLLLCATYGCRSSLLSFSSPGSGSPPVVPPPDPEDLRLAMVGDVMLDRGVADAIAVNGLGSILPVVSDQLQAADIAFANLECPLATVGPHDPAGAVFRADPSTVTVLLQGGFDIVSLANNHALNSGLDALIETIGHLEDAGISYVGAAREEPHASDPVFLEARGARIGSLAYTDLAAHHSSQSKVGPGLTKLQTQVAAAKAGCDLLVVSFHWGVEDSDVPTERQVAVAHASIDSGADLVVGHHPHVLQGAEIYRNRLILYSVGDFIFDPGTTDEAESGIFEIYYGAGRGLQLRMTPVIIPASRMGPEYPSPAERDCILERFGRLSASRRAALAIANGIAFLDCPF
jgi:poly-gamma-glutamate synthesis protein (capsule biosynthesis protein)